MQTILLVEDETIIGLAETKVLEGFGYKVQRVRTGEVAVEAACAEGVDLVLMDIDLGEGIDGTEAARRIFERFFGAKEEDIVGKDDYAFLAPELADFFRCMDRAAKELGKQRSNEEWITFADDGHRALLETIKTPILDSAGKSIGILGIGRDITERKRIEQVLKESEASVKRKLDAIVEPGGDVGELGLSDIIDVPMLQSLLDDFSALTGMAAAILDAEGKVLVASGWTDICTKFHRACAESAAACTESDLFLAANVKSGEYVEYHCNNSLWDIVTPLYIGERHLGNIYSGQFFYTDDVVDETLFAAQAERFGYDRDAYLAALRRIPRFGREEISRLMDFLVRLTGFVSKLSYSNLRLARTSSELKKVEEKLSKSVAEKETLLKELQHRVKNSLSIVSSLLRLNMDDLDDERSKRIFQEAVDGVRCVAMIYDRLSESTSSDKVELLRSTYANEAELRVSDDGPGLPPGLDVGNASSLGLRIMGLLATDIGGGIEFAPGKGTTAVLRF